MSNGNQSTGAAGGRNLYLGLVVLMLLGLGFSLYTFSTVAEREADDGETLIHIRDIRQEAPDLAEFADEATRGDLPAYEELRRHAVALAGTIATLNSGREVAAINPFPVAEGEAGAAAEPEKEVHGGHAGDGHVVTYTDPAILEQVQATVATWGELAVQVNRVIGTRNALNRIYGNAEEVENDHIPALIEALQALVDDLVERKAPADRVATVARLLRRTEALGSDLSRLLRGSHLSAEDQETAAEQLFVNSITIEEILVALTEGSDDLNIKPITQASSKELLEAAVEAYSGVGEGLFQIEEFMQDVYEARAGAAESATLVKQLTANTERLEEAIQILQSRRFLSAPVGYFSGGVGLLALLLLGWLNVREARERHAETMRQKAESDALNARNQEAILTLLDELSYLAEGDLSKKATVTEEITGAIADSVNYSIDALRTLVTTINATSEQVTEAARQSRSTTMQLADSSEQQARQITDTGARIDVMARSMGEVSEQALNSAEVAKRSVDIAHEGAGVVRRSISGMNTIREQIQETSKRIKRLGESSQEIGAIVELINDIADQTNILALNAAIQAAMAGEAGRGFAVVADEVQRLAERSTDATKQIGALINTIQADTNEAVSSMEQSTTNVVSGAQLASDAGTALEQIETVSNQLYELIQGIAETARHEAETAAEASNSMNSIREITTQTTAGTNETAESIGKLAELAEELRASVAGFKLSEA